MKSGRVLNDSVRLIFKSRWRAKACASTSRSYRISRWSATKPIGQTRMSVGPALSIAASAAGAGPGLAVGARRLIGNLPVRQLHAGRDEPAAFHQLVGVAVAFGHDA